MSMAKKCIAQCAPERPRAGEIRADLTAQDRGGGRLR